MLRHITPVHVAVILLVLIVAGFKYAQPAPVVTSFLDTEKAALEIRRRGFHVVRIYQGTTLVVSDTAMTKEEATYFADRLGIAERAGKAVVIETHPDKIYLSSEGFGAWGQVSAIGDPDLIARIEGR